MAKEIPQHYDRLGKEINIGSHVAFPASNSLYIGEVIKLNPKMIGVQRISKGRSHHNKYPIECVVVDSSDVTVAILKGDL
jgi:hypothetical protein